jgi:hypothetical protein
MTFALITEGISEYTVIQHLISRYFIDEEPIINQIQPKLEKSKQFAEGGWNEVLKYCERVELSQILVENDYAVIQIDTDQSQQAPFSVAHAELGHEKTPDRLLADVIARLEKNMPENVDKSKVIFAICIHTIECWLLPLVCTGNKKEKIKGCLPALNRELRRRNMPTISETGNKNSPASRKAYQEILKPLRKKSDIEKISVYHVGFQKFADNLKSLKE